MANHSTATDLIEVDDCESGYDTNKSTSAVSETTSLSSSIQEYLEENGRRYHAYYGPDKNLMPTDEVEQERLDVHHEIMRLIAKNELYKAPIQSPHRVLDLGTGTGIWAIDYADEHPEAEVVGLDLSPIQSTWVPPNCRFEVDDFELEWTYQKESFDFIHGRNITHSIKSWPFVLSQVMSHLKPGAWFELAELGSVPCSDDDSMPDDWAPKHLAAMAVDVLENKLGRIVPTADWMEKLLVDAGFVDVEVSFLISLIPDMSKIKTFKQPLGPWPKQKDLKQAGTLFAMSSHNTYSSYGMSLFTRGLGMSVKDVEALCTAAYQAHIDKTSKVHAYSKLKPFE